MPVSFIGAGNFKGYWDASDNSGSVDPSLHFGEPLLASSASATAGYNVGVKPALTASVGDYWQVNVAGSTNIDGESTWNLNDWCIYQSSSASGFTWSRLSVTDTTAATIIGNASESGLKNTLLASASAGRTSEPSMGRSGMVLFCSSSLGSAGTQKYFEGDSGLKWDPYSNILKVTGSIVVQGTIEATQLHTNFVTSSVLYDDGDTKFGNSTDDQHQFTGSVYVLTGLTSSAGIVAAYYMGDGSRLTGIDAGSTLGNPGYGNPVTSRVPFFGVIDGASKFGLSGSANFSFLTASNELQVTGNVRATNYYAASSIIHQGDLDTLIAFGTNTVNVDAGGITGITVSDTFVSLNPGEESELDIALSSSNKTMVFVDSGTDRVGIAHGTPLATFDVSGSTILGRDDGATVTTLQVSGTAEFGDTIAVGQDIIHWGDPNTKISFTNDQIDFTAGGTTLLTLDEDAQNLVQIGDGTDVDLKVRGLNDDFAIFVEGSSDKVGIGTSNPLQKLSVSGSTVFGTAGGTDSHWFTGSIYVSDDIYVADRISNLNDTDTYIDFGSNAIDYYAGGLRGLEHATSLLDFNPDADGVNVRVQGTNNANTFFVADASANVGIRCAPTGTIQALTVSGSTLFGSASASTHEFIGSVTVSQNISFAGNLQNASDDDTYIDFQNDQIRLYAGNVQFADFDESGGQNITTLNGLGSDIDFVIKSNGAAGGGAGTNLTHTVFVEGSTARVGIAESSPGAQLDVSGSTILGRNDGATISSNQIKGTLYVTGNVGINTATTGYSIALPNSDDLVGRGLAYAWSTYSSARYKKDVITLSNPIDKAKKLRGVEFTWRDSGEKDFGFIAEEVGNVLPQLVSYEPDGKNAIGMDYSRITSLLVECVKYQQDQIEIQEKRIKTLEKKQNLK